MAGLDFTKIGGSGASDSATEPRRIFSALPEKNQKYGYPRDVQSEVWEAWHERRDERDLVIKMNTGGGKTLVGLILLKSCLNEGVGPAAYVGPDIYLADQVRAEAARLGIETTDDPESAAFRQSRAILVINIHRLFNGLSVFGVRGSGRPIVEFGTVLIDDAHACLTTVEEKFMLQIPAGHSACNELAELFEDSLKQQSPTEYMALCEGDASVVLRLPYWDWVDRQDAILEILHPHREDENFRFSWPLIKETLPICRAGISASGIEVAPPCPPVEMIPSIVSAKRRLYLTATLADDGVLVTHFDASATGVRVPITPRSADDLGDRMILTPSQTFPDASDEDIREFVAAQATERNVVVIVPSSRRAEWWEPVADAMHRADTLHQGLADLRKGHVGVVVLVNKYDGIDLPGDACHLLVLDRLPEAKGVLDHLDWNALDGSDALLGRQVQRIEQGMGRGVRSNDDFCAILLLGRRLAERLYPPKAREKFSPATRAQLELSEQVASMLGDEPFSELGAVVDQCLDRDPGWVSASRGVLDGLRYPDEVNISPIAKAQREAFAAAVEERYIDATERLQRAIDATDDTLLRGLLKEQAAAYVHHVDPVRARKLQLSAFADNRQVARPRGGIEYTHLREPAEQAKAAAGYLEETYESPERLLFGFGALLEQLTPNPQASAVSQFERAMLDLGRHLGFGVQCPEKEVGRGPDVLWMLGDNEYLVIECKSGSGAREIARSDMGQLSQSMDWFEETYDSTSSATPVLIHPSRTLDRKASARTGARIVTFDKLADMRDAVDTFASSIAHSHGYADPTSVGERLAAFQLNAGALVDRWTAPPKPAGR